MTKNVIVVGAGISGLATAFHLEQLLGADVDVQVVEASPRIGGTARTIHESGHVLETGPNGFLDNRPAMLSLCRSLGLEDRLITASPAAKKRLLFLGDRLRPLPTSAREFILSGLLSPIGKARLLAERFIPAKDLPDESIHEFGCRRIGKEATETLLDAFITGILAGDPKLLSLRACFPRMHEFETKDGGLFRAMSRIARERRASRQAMGAAGAPGGTLTTLLGGMGTLMDALASRLRNPILLESPVTGIERSDSMWRILTSNNRLAADAVVLAAPAHAPIVARFDSLLADEIAQIPYASATVCVVAYPTNQVPDPVDAFGYLTPQRLGRAVLGVVFTSSIFPSHAPAGVHQFRAILGGWGRPDVADWSDKSIVAEVQKELAQTIHGTGEPCFHWIQRWPRAIPQYHMGHIARLTRIDARLERHPGVFITGNAFRGVALNDCAADAERTAGLVADFLKNRDS